MTSRTARSDTAFVVGAPLLLAVLECFHPHPGDLLALDLRTWMLVHYAQIALFPLAALAVARLVHGEAGVAAALCRAAMSVFAVTWIAFDTAAGVVTGILVGAAHASGTPETWRAAIDAVWLHPVMGGSPALAAPPLLALLGSIALSVGTVAAAVSLRRAGHAWPPIVLLALSGFGVSVFKTHAWPGGPLTFGGIAAAAAWMRAARYATGGRGHSPSAACAHAKA